MAGGFFGVRPFFLLTFSVSSFHCDTICRIGYVDRLLAVLTETAIVAVLRHFFGGVVKKVKDAKNAEISVKTKEMDVFCHNMTYAFTTLFSVLVYPSEQYNVHLGYTINKRIQK